jgi:putative oxidoreductase
LFERSRDRTEEALMFSQLAKFTDLSLLLLRLMVAIVFVTSGWNHVKDPRGRAASIGMSPGFTAVLGMAQIAGGLGVAFGVLTRPAALGLILVMLGAIEKKIFVWHTGFWGEKNSGWNYELTLLLMNLVIATTGGGKYKLWK